MDYETVTVTTRQDAEILQGFHDATRNLRGAYAEIERLAASGNKALAQGQMAFSIGGNALAKVADAQGRFEAKYETLRLAAGITREHVRAAIAADALLVRDAEEA
jgi:uncharacterized caspase-like protein